MARVSPALVACALGLAACKPPIQAPDRLEETVVFGFVNFPSTEHLEVIVDPIYGWAHDNPEDIMEGLEVDNLTADDLALVGVDNPTTEGVLGALGRAVYEIDLDLVAEGISHPRKQDIYEGTTGWTILETTDRACFLAGECPSLRFVAQEENKVPLLGTSVRVQTTEMLWATDLAGERVLALRQLSPDPTELSTDILKINQQYGFSLMRARPEGGVERVETFWVDARVLGSGPPDGMAVRLAVQRMQSSATHMDTFFLGDSAQD